VSFSCLWNLLLLSGLGFINIVITLSLKFRVSALRLDQLYFTMWSWFLWKCQRTFDSTRSSLFTTLLRNQQLVHHFHSLHHLLPLNLDLSVLFLILIKLLGLSWNGQERWIKEETKIVWRIQKIPRYLNNWSTMGGICVWWKKWSVASPV
jgi:hypothetical protein